MEPDAGHSLDGGVADALSSDSTAADSAAEGSPAYDARDALQGMDGAFAPDAIRTAVDAADAQSPCDGGGACGCEGDFVDCGGVCVDVRATDATNCGRCGHDCQGGACLGGVCQPATVASQGVSFPVALAVGGTTVYWAEKADATQNFSNGAVKRAAIDAIGPAAPTLIAGSQAYPVAIAVNSSGLYWANAGNGASALGGLMWLPIGGTTPAPLATAYTCPNALILSASSVYWFDCGTMNNTNEPLLTLPVADPAATPTPIGATRSGCAFAMALSGTNLFWLESGCFLNAGSLNQVTLPDAGSPIDLLPSTTLSGPYSNRIAVDAQGVYYSDDLSGQFGAGSIFRAPLGGGTPVTLVPTANANAIAVDAVNIYWTDTALSAVMYAPLATGSPVGTLASGQTNPYDLVIDSTSVYWTNNSSPGAIVKIAKP